MHQKLQLHKHHSLIWINTSITSTELQLVSFFNLTSTKGEHKMRKNSMFNKPLKLLGAGSLLFAALLAAQPAVAQLITGSRHDLTAATGTGTGSKLTGTTEICVFCHTPHGASTGAATGGLLWNRAAPAVGGYTLYTSTTVDSTFLQPGGNSNMCFSCHDGVTSIDNVVNRPGSGGYTAAPSAWGAGYTWANGGALPAATNVAALGIFRAQKLPPRRQIIEKRTRFDLRSRRFSAITHRFNPAAGDDDFRARDCVRFSSR